MTPLEGSIKWAAFRIKQYGGPDGFLRELELRKQSVQECIDLTARLVESGRWALMLRKENLRSKDVVAAMRTRAFRVAVAGMLGLM